MVGAPPREEEQNRLTQARDEFVATLPRRLDVVRAALSAFAEAPSDRERLNGLLRRLHALGSSARVLGLVSVAEVLTEAEHGLRRALSPGRHGPALQETARALDLVPTLIQGGPTRSVERAEEVMPLSVLLVGTDRLAETLASEFPGRYETESTTDLSRARELARSGAPDAVVLDADQPRAKEWLERLTADDQVDLAVVVIGSFNAAEGAAAYAAVGADRVLTKPVSPDVLDRLLQELALRGTREPALREPLGELSIEELTTRIATEVRKGLVESLSPGGDATRVNFGDGADVLGAVWGAVARVRELVTVRSTGNVRFHSSGPEGAIPLAPWLGEERRVGERSPAGRQGDDVGLRGRRVVIADDDPAVVWFLSGLFKAVGADVFEAHDGERALELTFQTWPDLVVSDVLMPRRDGFSLCHEIKRDIAVRDVPVILLSWKEDLLQRLRELGASADGYLRKEANASVVVERVREVLRPRARIEQRLASGGEVRGRIDGVTTRLVLELAANARPDAVLTIRDAVYLYEVTLRDGRVRALSRSAPDGSIERGPRVLAGLLGVSAGRFVLQNGTGSRRLDLDVSLRDLIEEPVRRARGALLALSAQSLSRVLRVGVDLPTIGRYLECTPESARVLIERLAAGESPRMLLLTGQASPWLLEAVLSDLARRGAILDVEREASQSQAPANSAVTLEFGPANVVVTEDPEPSVRLDVSAAPDAVPGPAAAAVAPEPDPSPIASRQEYINVSERRAAAPKAQVAEDEADFSSLGDGWADPPRAADTRVSGNHVSDASPVSLALGAVDPTAATAPPLQSAALGSQPPPADVPDAWFAKPAPRELLVTRPEVAETAPEARAATEESDSVFDALSFTSDVEPVGPRTTTSEAQHESPSAHGEHSVRVGVRPVLKVTTKAADRASPSMADVFAAALEEAPFNESGPMQAAKPATPLPEIAPDVPTSTLLSAQGESAAAIAAVQGTTVNVIPVPSAVPPPASDTLRAAAGDAPTEQQPSQSSPPNLTGTLTSSFGSIVPIERTSAVEVVDSPRAAHPSASLAETLASEDPARRSSVPPEQAARGAESTAPSTEPDTATALRETEAAPRDSAAAALAGTAPLGSTLPLSSVPAAAGLSSTAPLGATALLGATAPLGASAPPSNEAGTEERAVEATALSAQPLASEEAPARSVEVALSSVERGATPAKADQSERAPKVAEPAPTAPPPPAASRPTPRVTRDSVPVAASSRVAKAKARASLPPSAEPESGGSWLTILLLIFVAFFGAYGLITWVVVPLLFRQAEREPAAATPPPPVTPAPVPTPVKPSLRAEELDLPPGINPGTGLGVLELVAAPDDLLYLDNTFVGRGPSRLVSVGAGNHVVRIARGEVEISGQVAATAGKRVRVSLELPARAPAKP